MHHRPMSLLEYCLATATDDQSGNRTPIESTPPSESIDAAPLHLDLPVPPRTPLKPKRPLLRSGSVL